MNRSRYHLLRLALAFDAITCVLMSFALLIAGGALGDFFAISPFLLRAAGAVLLLFAAGVGYMARRAEPPSAGVIAVIVLNALWAIESLLVLWIGWLEPNVFGTGFVVAQAIAVLVIAEVQLIGFKRARIGMVSTAS